MYSFNELVDLFSFIMNIEIEKEIEKEINRLIELKQEQLNKVNKQSKTTLSTLNNLNNKNREILNNIHFLNKIPYLKSKQILNESYNYSISEINDDISELSKLSQGETLQITSLFNELSLLRADLSNMKSICDSFTTKFNDYIFWHFENNYTQRDKMYYIEQYCNHITSWGEVICTRKNCPQIIELDFNSLMELIKKRGSIHVDKIDVGVDKTISCTCYIEFYYYIDHKIKYSLVIDNKHLQ